MIQSMLALDPAQRLSIAEIQSHPWYTGPCSTTEEIYTELSGRKTRIAQAAQVAQAQKEARARALASRGGVTGTTRNFKSGANLDDLDFSCSRDSSIGMSSSWSVPQLERKCGVYDPSSWKYSQILSPLEAEELFEFVQTFLAEKNARCEVSADTFKVNSRYTTDSDELAIEVKILKGEGLYCLDVEKLSGSHFDLMELFKDMAFSLEEHTNTLVTEA
jgi:serine/threonine protein kinase